MNRNNYYKAYEKRYKQVYEKNMMWSSNSFTPEVMDIIKEFNISKKAKILDLGCGEGRDAIYLLKENYNVLAIDYSQTVINKCNEITNNKFTKLFKQFDILEDKLNEKFDFIYSIAVLHMFVLEEHRNKYLNFIKTHLKKNGKALICIMGNGVDEYFSNIEEAFNDTKRIVLNNSSTINVATTSCRVVNWSTFENELRSNNLKIIKKWISKKIPEFNNSMCVVVKNN